MVRCPRDQQWLASNEGGGLRYHSCEQCAGLWIPGAALTRALSERGFETLELSQAAGEPGVVCPACHAVSQVRRIHGCAVDFCPRCRGLWLDQGEAEKIRTCFPNNSSILLAERSRAPADTGLASLQIMDCVAQILWAIWP